MALLLSLMEGSWRALHGCTAAQWGHGCNKAFSRCTAGTFTQVGSQLKTAVHEHYQEFVNATPGELLMVERAGEIWLQDSGQTRGLLLLGMGHGMHAMAYGMA